MNDHHRYYDTSIPGGTGMLRGTSPFLISCRPLRVRYMLCLRIERLTGTRVLLSGRDGVPPCHRHTPSGQLHFSLRTLHP
jgi:hypothetical protein